MTPECSISPAVIGGIIAGIIIGGIGALLLVRNLRRQVDPLEIVRENAVLREKVT